MIDITASVFYDKIAKKYEKEYKTKVDIAEDKFIMKLLDIRAKKNILDLGCGTGLFLEYCKDYHYYCGIDASRNMIKIAIEKFGNEWMRRFINIKMERIHSFNDRYFDYIFSLFGSLSYAKGIKNIFRIAYTKLSDEGKLFFMVYSRRYHNRVRSHSIDGKKYHIKNVRGYTKKELEGIIKELGFKNYKISGFRMIADKYINWIKNERLIKLIIEWEYRVLGRSLPNYCHFLIIEINKE